jgi:hypothetical protein
VPTVVVSPYNVVNFAAGGGHLWVYLQYAAALRALGCDVYWLERFRPSGDAGQDDRMTARVLDCLARYGFRSKVILHAADERAARDGLGDCRGLPRADAEAVLRRADLLLNFHYAIDPRLLGRFRRTALVDIDPGLLQVWLSTGQLAVPPHDVYFTIGETVGTPTAAFPDCGLRWHHIRPPVNVDLWPFTHDPACDRFTTVAGWWSGKWVRTTEDGIETLYENTKRVAFLEFIELPRRTVQPLELALYLADSDGDERRRLEAHGWHVRDSREVACDPEVYRSYVQRSRAEFSCAKPSCQKLRNAWMSDRTLCYLASGKPAVVQHTGRSSFLPSGEGLFRFTTLEEAADAIATVNADYPRQCRAAREIAEAYFDGRIAAAKILNLALAQPARARGDAAQDGREPAPTGDAPVSREPARARG